MNEPDVSDIVLELHSNSFGQSLFEALRSGYIGHYEGFRFIETPIVQAKPAKPTQPYWRRFEKRARPR